MVRPSRSRRTSPNPGTTRRPRRGAGAASPSNNHLLRRVSTGAGLRRPPTDLCALRTRLPLARRTAGRLRHQRLPVPVRARQAGGAERARAALRAGVVPAADGRAGHVEPVSE